MLPHEVIPFFKTLKQHFEGVQKALFKEVKKMEEIFDQMSAEVDLNTMDKQCAEIERKNLLIANENLIEDLKAQLGGNLKNVTSDSVKPKVLAPGMYAIDVKPIPHPLKNNRSAHLTYINHLKESVETVREIVEEARVVKPLDNALNYACQYTKLSQELLEYVIGTCPKSFNERDNKAPSTPVTRKKQVTFNDKPGTSSSNTQKHKVHQKVQQTNVPVIHSTGVNTFTEASESKPRSNTKKNRIMPAKSKNKKKVEDHPRTNKSVWTKVNRVDSSISSKRVVINSNSASVCKPCNKCLNSANHEMCVVNILNSVNATPTVKTVLNNGKRVDRSSCRFLESKAVQNNNVESFKSSRIFVETSIGTVQIGRSLQPSGVMEIMLLVTVKHTCFVRDINGADILKGSRSTNLYTISIDEMMKSSPEYACCPKLPSPNHDVAIGSAYAPTDKELEMLFQPMFDEYLEQSRVNEPVPSATEINAQVVPPGTSLSTTIAQDAPSTSASSSTSDMHHPVRHQEIAEEPTHEDPPINHDVLHPSHNLVTGEPGSAQSSSGNVNSAEPNQVNYPPDHLRRWTKDHPLDNIVGNPSRPVSTRK
ncbi:hypothetical protein Tco_0705659 [Tanacetum coccineum]|uniref:Integrase, catalytic region, zinc finger, CCHC-type, peptidase aspartic, catalytic n=1 Tax=Tanacetum coccineum TaxID=301880 RepID=A0ABQ4Y6R2_9ASTR